MKKLVICLFFASSVFGMSVRNGDLIGSGGAGLTFGPTLLLLSPELEYVYRSDMNFGGLLQMAIGGSVLFTVDGKVRYILATNSPKMKPSFEGGLGLAIGSSSFSSSVGAHIFFGGGFDYFFDRDTSIGTMFRINFAPPLDGVFVSWPMIIGRFRL